MQWEQIPLINGWTVSVAGYELKICMDYCGFVHIKGLISGVNSTDSLFAEIPQKYRNIGYIQVVFNRNINGFSGVTFENGYQMRMLDGGKGIYDIDLTCSKV